MMASLEDELMTRYGGWWRHLARWVGGRDGRVPSWMTRWIFRRAQRRAERLHARMRADLLCLDQHLETALAFSGRPE
jgi:preprotein translocase subunit SecA